METQPLFSLIQPYQLLQKNDVVFVNHADGFFSLKKGDKEIEVRCGDWAAIWMNNYIRSEVKGVNLFPLCFSQDNALKNVGRLGRAAPNLTDMFKGAGGLELDMKLAQLFTVSRVELGAEGSKIADLKTAYAMDTVDPVPAHELLELNDDGVSQVKLGTEAGDVFYMAVELKQFKSVTNDSDVPPKIWEKFIVKERLSWNMCSKVLYLSNAYTAKLGLPPNHEILGFNMALELKDWKISAPDQTLPVVAANQVQEGPAMDWKKSFAQFMSNPSYQTFIFLRTQEVRKAFKLFKNNKAYNHGTSRKHKLTTRVIERFDGIEGTFTELAQAVSEVAGTSPEVQFCLLMKLEGQVKQVMGDGNDADKFYLNVSL